MKRMKYLPKKAIVILSLLLMSLFLFSCSKKEKLTALATGPAISGVSAGATTSTGATIVWTTDVASTSQVFYGTTTNFGSQTTEKDTGASMTRNHSVNLTGLTAGTLYYFYVASKDTARVQAKSGTDGSLSFTTSAAGPVISAVTVTTAATSATITWTTDVPSTTNVFYGTTNTFGSSKGEVTTLVTSHSATLTGLTAGVQYYYYVYSKNAAGNASTVGDDGSKSFTISSTPTGTAFYLFLDDVQVEGTGGTTRVIYDDNIHFITMGTNNAAYMGSPNNGVDNISSIDFNSADNPHSGTYCWKISMSDTTAAWWAGIYVLATGTWRTSFSGSETTADLSGPTGTVKLTCWARVSNNKTPTKIKIGIGDDSGKAANASNVDTVPNSKVSSAKLVVTDTWQKIEVSLGSNPNLSSINGIFFWAIDSADVP